MDQTRWNQIEALLQSALDLEPDQRAAFLSRVHRDDEDLFRELDSLLRAASGSIDLEPPAMAHLAGRGNVSLAGQQIGHYRVGRSIGAGGMGEIYEAFDERL
ncbi:MAG TPA: hypothetical protein VM599_00040, partial [Thermoanaerobaculia bacterium]|nr:hypothetical protein [Thermoanaerobaculia bacterium]